MKVDPALTSLSHSSRPNLSSQIPDRFDYDPTDLATSQSEIVVPDVDHSSFAQMLDYAFPEEVAGGIVQVGEVTYIGDGVCKVTGLPLARVEDILQIETSEGSVKALILGIEETYIESVVLGDYSKIKQGNQVKATNTRLKIPCGKDLFGRVINPLGEAMDGKGKFDVEAYRDVEFPAPSVMERCPIYEQIRTGIMVVDTTIPIGRGQRELVIGDRKTGKTQTVVDAICNQKGQDVICIYVGVGMQAAKAKSTQRLLAERGADAYTIMVVALSDKPPTLQYIAPYAGAAIGEHFMYQGKHVLIVYDDLSKQAKAYRQVSLLLKRSPGRDAYPGDIFFLHSRLLERASKLHARLGEGSITALPVAETQGGDVSDYIITNLMSITDGHVYLDANMMHEGILPAVNSGLSVSRVGSKVQCDLHKKVGELASRALARYQEVKSFETINTEVADDTLRDIRRGKRVTEIFAQDSSTSYSNDEQIVLLYLVLTGRLDLVELTAFMEFRRNFLKFYREHVDKELVKDILSVKKLEVVEVRINALYDAFDAQFKKGEEAELAALVEASIQAETPKAPDASVPAKPT